MKVLKNKRKGNTVTLEIEASLDTVNEAIDNTFKRMVKSAKVPGFRKGKVPRGIFEKHYGKGVLLKDGVTDAVNMAYSKALKELDLDVVDYPQNLNIGEYKENEPLKFTCEVDVKPEIKLGKYKGVKITKEPETASEDKVNEQLKTMQENNAEYSEKDGGDVSNEDIIRLDMKATIDGEEYAAWSRQNMGIKVGLGNFGEDFDAELTGLKKDEEKSFAITYKDDFNFKDVAGKKVDFSVKIIEIREKKLPELNDAFAEKVSEFKTIKSLQADIQAKLDIEQKRQSEEKLRSDIIEAIAEKSKMEIPEGMIKHEVAFDKRQMESSLQQSKFSIEQYLAMQGQTMEQFEEVLKESATKRVTADLILEKVAKDEKVEATDDEINEEIKKFSQKELSAEEIEREKKKLNMDGLNRMIIQRKTVDFLIAQAKIEEKK